MGACADWMVLLIPVDPGSPAREVRGHHSTSEAAGVCYAQHTIHILTYSSVKFATHPVSNAHHPGVTTGSSARCTSA
jgi:hypothetical protein